MYSSTASFMSLMDSKGIKYDYLGINPDTKKEYVTVKYTGDNVDDITVNFFFGESCEEAALRVFDLVKVPANKTFTVYSLVNKMNNTYRFAKFCFDESDNTIQIEIDPVFRDADCAEICVELLLRAVNIADEAYQELSEAISY